ncbi:MAG: N-acetylmuramoyl-L-alanine amidase [Acidobacteriota bacterium]|nr:N-acetylmuramoyl-L-alanine amidase [Acidobacteriota bacterium]
MLPTERPAAGRRRPGAPARLAAAAALAAGWMCLAPLLSGSPGETPTPTPTPIPAGNASLVWKGEAHPIAVSGGDLRVADVARALGFELSTDPTSGVIILSSGGHQVFLGIGTMQVPVDQRIVQISRQARSVGGALYAPPDILDRVLLPLVGATATYDPNRRVWTVVDAVPPLTIDVAVVHVEPTTQIVLKESVGARFIPTLTEGGFQIRWPDRKILPPFPERRYEDPLVAAIRFAGDTATIEFREKGLSARAYPLPSPDRLVIEVGRAAAAPGFASAPAPAPVPTPAWTIVIDAGHGGTETGAIGPGGLQEKDATLQIARRVAATLPRLLSCRVLMTRDSDSAISLDDRTAVANHEKADLFLSIHANSSRATGARGSETYYISLEASDKLAQDVASRENVFSPAMPLATGAAGGGLDFILWDLAQSAHLKDSSELAEAIQQELNGVSGTENRGIKQAPFRVLVGATMPAVLVETAFISNSEEEKKLGSPTFQQSVADGIAKAIAAYFDRRKGAGPQPTPAGAARARTP